MSKERWWTYPAEGESGKTIIVTGHDYLDKIIDKGKHKYRIDIDWRYESLPNGMPDDDTAELMGQATDALMAECKKDTAAVMTGIYTGEGIRTWVFYTTSLVIFGKILNRALADLPTLPLEIRAEEDADWEEYKHMRSETFIPDDEFMSL
ncbi:MAG: DUF695 domain-containing protein [Prevotella sp.]|nr:DUF695 domain-containing protein [Bacteroides sp.]MCM1365746.1 DUF695 domain-containing protein [Prevotella sp.]MCM1436416.1 DUF695 domain-containing protein [Prevotella sp.]